MTSFSRSNLRLLREEFIVAKRETRLFFSFKKAIYHDYDLDMREAWVVRTYKGQFPDEHITCCLMIRHYFGQRNRRIYSPNPFRTPQVHAIRMT